MERGRPNTKWLLLRRAAQCDPCRAAASSQPSFHEPNPSLAQPHRPAGSGGPHRPTCLASDPFKPLSYGAREASTRQKAAAGRGAAPGNPYPASWRLGGRPGGTRGGSSGAAAGEGGGEGGACARSRQAAASAPGGFTCGCRGGAARSAAVHCRCGTRGVGRVGRW